MLDTLITDHTVSFLFRAASQSLPLTPILRTSGGREAALEMVLIFKIHHQKLCRALAFSGEDSCWEAGRLW